ncbi:MAG: transcriptional coactivator p15/PC4 family protein [Xanthobacteraceae bacterium]
MQTLAQNEPRGNRPQTDSDVGIIAEWPLKRHECLRVSIELFNGLWLINSRKWFEAENGEWRPGKQGIALGVKHLPQLAEAVTKALSIARDCGLIPADSEGSK